MIRFKLIHCLLFPLIFFVLVSDAFNLDRKIQYNPSQITTVLNRIPLNFTENRGQVSKQVKYLAKTPYGNFYFCPDRICYQFIYEMRKLKEFRTLNIHLSYLESNDGVSVEAGREGDTKVNYYLGRDDHRWVSGAKSFTNIIYRDLYPSIDLIIDGNRSSMKNEYRVKSGGNVEDIQMKYEGVKELRINERGELEIDAGPVLIKEDPPLSYQIIEGQRIEVETKFCLKKGGIVGFEVGDYRKDTDLVIDPNLIFSTYLGGTGGEYGNDIALDNEGNIYITGWTWSSDFPTTPGAFDPYLSGYRDVFIAKLNPPGTRLLYATYLGGYSTDEGWAIAVGAEGDVYVAGYTWSYSFPVTRNSYDKYFNGGRDVFVVKFDATDFEILYSTFLGGESDEEVGGIAIDHDGRVYVAGWTDSTDYPTTSDAFDTAYNGSRDIFVSKLSPGGAMLLFSTYLGGSDDDFLGRIDSNDTDKVGGITIDEGGRVYVTGYTGSTDFPVSSNAFDTTHNGDQDAFVSKLSSDGTKLIFSTYLGGSGIDEAGGIVLDGEGTIHITGWTGSYDFPTTTDAYKTSKSGSQDAFLSKLSPSGSKLFFSTFLGGSSDDHGIGISVDGNNDVYITGWTASSDFPVYPDSYEQAYHGQRDVFLAKFNFRGTGLLYSTYLGGVGSEHGYSIVEDGNRSVYITGWTWSSDFPVTDGAVGPSYGGDYDIFVSRIRFPERPTYILTISSEDGGTTDPPPGEYKYHEETLLTVKAIPDSDHGFSGWSGDVHFGSQTIDLTIDCHKSIKAEFYTIGDWGGEWGNGGGGGWNMGPCFIATAAYDSPLHPHVKILRTFRDKYLLTHMPGRLFVRIYYKHSPELARLIKKNRTFKMFIRVNLTPLVICSYILVNLGPLLSLVIFSLTVMLSVLYFGIQKRKIEFLEKKSG